jgi:hypothetical protein
MVHNCKRHAQSLVFPNAGATMKLMVRVKAGKGDAKNTFARFRPLLPSTYFIRETFRKSAVLRGEISG